jgi:hypothetical protein
MNVGTTVCLLEPLLGNPEGAVGVCYEVYDIGHVGYSIIFQNGAYDGFSEEEAEKLLEEVGFEDSVADYDFTNVMRLSEDFNKGVFKKAFPLAM